ncbi:rRNA maturation RNase YbeY [Leptolyngbya ectocarpi]|uniref:rRNA maturation RNase YbeY n=1 Tax=Leptolyngbya ectocarpi TaxID=1202 RepID=UPI001D137FF7|nr:rRNA maturation RNase YbeY [Leptolyngbya ectocarpi]
MTQYLSPEIDLWVDTTELVPAQSSGLPTPQTWQIWFETWLSELQPTASPINQYEVSLLLTNDATIQQLNATYRHQDQATDVLAFATQDTDMPGAEVIYQSSPRPLGDVIISVETAQRQRHNDHYTLSQELAWLAAHGLLHLLGWDHPDDASLKIMLDKQYRLLETINLIGLEV